MSTSATLTPLPELKSGSIIAITPLAQDHPVYKVKLTSGVEFVVKSEQQGVLSEAEESAAYTAPKAQRAVYQEKREKDTKASIVWGSKIMKNVTGRREELRAKPLTNSEVQILKTAFQRFLPKDDLVDNPKLIWVKMPFVEDLKDGQYKPQGATEESFLKKLKIVLGNQKVLHLTFRLRYLVTRQLLPTSREPVRGCLLCAAFADNSMLDHPFSPYPRILALHHSFGPRSRQQRSSSFGPQGYTLRHPTSRVLRP
jgi:hypothetical protein